jgi:hypothetical protein
VELPEQQLAPQFVLAEAGIGELSLQVKASWLKSQWSVKRDQSTRLLGTAVKLLWERSM